MKNIEKYLEQAHLSEAMLKMKVDSYKKHPDIAREFEYWIEHRKYLPERCVEIEGYTAKKLSELSEFLDGEGAFALLIELRETPKKAIKKISRGFHIK